MSLQPIVKVTAALLAALSLAGCGAPDGPLGANAQPIENGELVADPASVSLGRVAVGSEARASVRLTNRGGYTVDVTRVLPPGPCRAVLVQPCVRPGETVEMTVACAPTAPGDFRGDVALTYRNGSRYDQTLRVPVEGSAYLAR